MQENKPKTALIVIIYAVAFICGGLITALYYENVYSLVYAFAGLISTWVFSLLCHEAGHAIIAKINKFDIIKFSVCGFTIDKTSVKKFSFKPFAKVGGETAVLPKTIGKKGGNGEKYALITLFGLVFHALAVIGFMLALVFCDDLRAKAFFAFFTLSLASFAVNGAEGLVPDSDAAVLANFTRYSGETDGYDNYLNILLSLRQGKTYAETDEKYFVCENCSARLSGVMRLFKLKREEELGNKENARLQALNEPCERADEEFCAEAAYIGYITGDSALIERYGGVTETLDNCDSPFAQRLRLAKAKYTGDEQYLTVAVPSALKACDKEFFLGDGVFNKKLILRGIK